MALYLTFTDHSGPIHLIDKETGKEIEIAVQQIGRQFRIGITAPDSILILRDKLYKEEQGNVD